MGRLFALRDARLRDDRDHLLTAARIKLTVVGLLAAAAAAWLLVDELSGPGARHPLAWRDLTSETGRLVLPREVTREFISEPQLAAYLHSRGAGHVPRVDFPRWRAVLITLGPRSSSAYSLRVLGVVEEGSRVTVRVERRNAGLADAGIPRLTFPYRLITLPATGKRVHLDSTDR